VVTDRLEQYERIRKESFAYYPFGESARARSRRDKFATYFGNRRLDYAEQRYYNSSLGRFCRRPR